MHFLSQINYLTEDTAEAIFNKALQNRENKITVFSCPNLSEEQCNRSMFWKELICGRENRSPSYLIAITTTQDFREKVLKEYNLKENNFTEEFWIVCSIFRRIFELSSPWIPVYREVFYNNRLLEGIIHFSNQQISSFTERDGLSFSLNPEDGAEVQTSILVLPRKTIKSSRWNLRGENSQEFLDRTVLKSLQKLIQNNFKID